MREELDHTRKDANGDNQHAAGSDGGVAEAKCHVGADGRDLGFEIGAKSAFVAVRSSAISDFNAVPSSATSVFVATLSRKAESSASAWARA
jgi:hypothetical protein